MTDTANFFYRVDAGRLLAAVIQVPEKQRGEWVLQLALDLVASDSEAAHTEYAQTLISEANSYRATKADAGRKGGLARVSNAQAQLKQSQAQLKQNKAPPNDTQARSSSSNRSSTIKPFDHFWSKWPHRVAKKAAIKAWEKIAPDEELIAVIINAIDRHKTTDQWQRGIIPHPATWLNGRRWEDEVAQHNEPTRQEVPSWLKIVN